MKLQLQLVLAYSICLLLAIVNVPLVICEEDIRYSQCKTLPFGCGFIKNVSYPFWGNGRPGYCGHPIFGLECQFGITGISISSDGYTVLNISEEDQIMRIVRKDLWENVCLSSFRTTTLNFAHFKYTPDDVNITLLYGCPPKGTTDPSNRDNCLINGINSEIRAYFTVLPQSLPSCNQSIVVPVLQTTIGRLMAVNSTFSPVLREGFNVEYSLDHVSCDQCRESSGECGYDVVNEKETCFCPDGGCRRVARSLSMRTKVAIGIGSAGGTLIVVAICCLMGNSYTFIWKRSTENAANVEAFLKDCGPLPLTRYKYSDVKKLANSFEDKIGQGGYGSVYKGMLTDGRMVAIKILSETKGNGTEFINEVASISKTSHVNIVSLLGFCIEGKKRALIYEFMPNGSLEKFIYHEAPSNSHPHLGWETLYKISIGIARGLEYLHRGCNTRIVHFDIKPHNILLDQNFCPKISDFGLSKLGHQEESTLSMTGARGTPGYIAPELVSRTFGGVSHKSDVYSYGMMVLEMAGGKKKLELRLTDTSEMYFPDWIYKRLEMNEDMGMHGITSSEDQDIAKKMTLVGLWCIQMNPSNRPPMSQVLDVLEGSLEALQVPPRPFLSSPPRENEDSPSTISIS